ncbi:hypothetical protein JOC95_002031 [Bacillus tianshenii]|uniref:DUF3732 domain-containing protein n=1 Tax=Sutcliffiella tianshenii TaxID=1463404 RepID=A0ABS2NZR2_9BACI|nr:DUF3732 domain-containing protein [Bacillus tianshenii]MBM7620178.1 hypothetical protein [Bacillus tianshenii]
MTLQIKEIILYNQEGEIRSIEFQPGKVNIITGKSKTGKSAIIEIVEYCLGRSEFLIPEGVIRKTVAMYAIKLHLNDEEIFIAKAPPEGQGQSQSGAYIELGKDITPPPLTSIKPNSNEHSIVEFLGNSIGISPNKHVPKMAESRDSLEGNFKHARLFLFQKQSVIADESVLFHRQKEPFMPQAIKDVLPYFLGAVREDYIKLENELRKTKRELKLLKKQQLEAEMLSGSGTVKAQNLLQEAVQVGLVEEGFEGSEEEVITRLKACLSFKPSNIPGIETDGIESLREERSKHINELNVIDEQIKAAESYANEASGYSIQANEQRLRLESIALFEEVEDGSTCRCPFCSAEIDSEIPHLSNMNDSLQRLQTNLQAVVKERPKLRTYIESLESEKAEKLKVVKAVSSSIETLIYEQEVAREIEDINRRISRVIGRISLFLENYREIEEDDELLVSISEKESHIEYLEELLDKENKEEILTSILSRISKYMTDWAQELELEHSNAPYRLDIKNLTVVADQEERPIPLNRMGSGENWLGCHLISHLALHKYFIQKNRPVPSFLILDQPTQVYFPPEIDEDLEGDVEKLKDEDRKAVKMMFRVLFSVCEELYPDLQIIVLDHANLQEEEFQDALVEKPWRNGRALIPNDWIKN